MSDTPKQSDGSWRLDRIKLAASLLEIEARVMEARVALLRNNDAMMQETLMSVRVLVGDALTSLVHPATSEYFIAVPLEPKTDEAGR